MAQDFTKISVQRGIDQVIVDNPTKFPLIGKGKQGAVFQISPYKVVKVYWNPKSAAKEADVLAAGKASTIIPKLYEKGPNYVVMEFVQGESLQDYLEGRTEIPPAMVRMIVSLFKEMERLKFGRMDVATKHVIITENEELKLLDHTNSFSKKLSIPLRFLNRLRKMDLLDSFFQQAKKLDKVRYSKWKKEYQEYLTQSDRL
ncbi:hypothetical protein [Peribacillus sp. SCS-155]|uniref:hypothetical protein n=1 Tax=Peribacillus sedimenti TaxID=3115297 RepID=UPI0039065B55